MKKQVGVTFFKKSGKFYTSEVGYIDSSVQGGTNDYWDALKGLHRIKDMDMLVEDSDDDVNPYIVPHLFKGED